jgi:hypothetical protein
MKLAEHAAPPASCATHTPAELQNCVPVHVSGSCAFVIVVHAPVPAAHAVHAAVHAEEAQQYPSLHKPNAHIAFALHAAPAGLGT